MKSFFAVYIIFSLIVFGQKKLISNILSDAKARSSAITTHEHVHSLGTVVEMILLGGVGHNHSHKHGDNPWEDTQAHESNAHDHFDNQKIKIDLIAQKVSFRFHEKIRSEFLDKNSEDHHFEFVPDIFRPPIIS